MRNLDAQLRAASQVPAKEAPSNAIWEGIEAQLDQKDRKRRGIFFWWTGGLSLTVFVAMAFLLPTTPASHQISPLPGASENPSITELSISSSPSSGSRIKPLISQSVRPLTDQVSTSGPIEQTVAISPLRQKQALPIPASEPVVLPSESTDSTQTTLPLPKLLEKTDQPQHPKPLSRNLATAMQVPLSEIKVPPIRQVLIQAADSYQPHWQIAASYLPLSKPSPGLLFLYTDEREPNSFISRPVTIDGQLDTLWRQSFIENNSNQPLDKAFRVRALRQWASGWYSGFGLAYYNSQFDTETYSQQVAQGTGLYTLGAREEVHALLLSLSVGYTFLRRKRIQPFMGLHLSSTLLDRIQRRFSIYEPTTGRENLQQDLTQNDGFTILDVRYTYLELGVNYQINHNWSVGVLPLVYYDDGLEAYFGAEVRYRLWKE